MLLTQGLGSGGVRSARAWLMVGAWGLLVTGCGTELRIGNLAAGGGQSEPGASTAGAAGQQLLAASAGRGQMLLGGGGAGAGAPGSGAGAHAFENDVPSAGSRSNAGTSDAAGGSALPGKQYPGQGFIVHEWGTDTIVVGSDGSLQRGLHHEEEDLPSFVYDRRKAGLAIGSNASPSVTIKMETPVTYFYSPTPLLLNASVQFPKGVLTQWYPGVSSFLPHLAAASSVTGGVPDVLSDPALDPSFPFPTEMCRAKYASLAGGRLDWGNFSIQGRGAVAMKPLPDAPLSQFGWSYARAVDANLIEMPSGENERFLFYRGLGEFDLPVKVRAEDAGKIKMTNGYAEGTGTVFLLNVAQNHGAFVEHSAGIAAGAALEDTVPSLDGAMAVDEYANRLSDAVTKALDTTGLYHDEAIAMVNTWRRQWFRTPGVRALYLLPQSWTEQSIPLTISPKPDGTVRVMLIRVELITKEQEAADVSALSAFDTDPARGAAYFSDLGRFAEPRLRRALQLSASAAGEEYLSQIAQPKSGVVSSE